MSTRFEKFITRISNEVSVQSGDRQGYTKDFDAIRDHVLMGMKNVNKIFRRIYRGPRLFGSYYENLRINKPDEFDVHFILTLPFYKHTIVESDEERPGFVNICLSNVFNCMENDLNHTLVYKQFQKFVDDNDYLNRSLLQKWLEKIIIKALNKYGNKVKSPSDNDTFHLTYLKRGTAHTIKAESIYKKRKISIDFVPAFKFDGNHEWLADRQCPLEIEDPHWFAVPKPTIGPKENRFLTFSICVPQVEKHLLNNKYNLKTSMRLFKSLRNRYNLRKLKSYFIRSIYLLEEEEYDCSEFWMKPPGEILIFMVDRLLEYLDDGEIPFYWCPDLNLLDGLDEDEISKIENSFLYISKLLKSYSREPKIKYETVKNLFNFPI